MEVPSPGWRPRSRCSRRRAEPMEVTESGWRPRRSRSREGLITGVTEPGMATDVKLQPPAPSPMEGPSGIGDQ